MAITAIKIMVWHTAAVEWEGTGACKNEKLNTFVFHAIETLPR
jgi:hypothetical protein